MRLEWVITGYKIYPYGKGSDDVSVNEISAPGPELTLEGWHVKVRSDGKISVNAYHLIWKLTRSGCYEPGGSETDDCILDDKTFGFVDEHGNYWWIRVFIEDSEELSKAKNLQSTAQASNQTKSGQGETVLGARLRLRSSTLATGRDNVLGENRSTHGTSIYKMFFP